MSVTYQRHKKYSTNQLVSKATTTVALTTTGTTLYTLGDVFSTGAYNAAMFVMDIKSNTSASPQLVLEVSCDGGTTYAAYTTLHADLTTTANKKATYVTGLGDYARIGISGFTTTTSVKLDVYAKFMLG